MKKMREDEMMTLKQDKHLKSETEKRKIEEPDSNLYPFHSFTFFPSLVSFKNL